MEQGITTTNQKSETSILRAIIDAAKDPKIDASKMEQILVLQERIMAHEKEIALNSALALLAPKLEPLKKLKQGGVTKGGDVKYFYTPYEDIDRMLRPHLREHGLSLSFDTREVLGKPWFFARVTEITKGGWKDAGMPYAPDTNSQLNSPQQIASGLSYAKRYAVAMLFNIVTEADDDGSGTSVIAPGQAEEINKMMTGGKLTPAEKKRFLDKVGKADSIEKIQADNFENAKTMLAEFIAKKGAAK